jgi:PBP1b-binding outer membrane lipoprotein LpoB
MGLDIVELVLTLAGELGVEIPGAAARRMRTPRDVIEWLVAAQERGRLFQSPPRRPGWFVTNHMHWPDPAAIPPVLTREAIAESVRRIVIEQPGIRPEDYREGRAGEGRLQRGSQQLAKARRHGATPEADIEATPAPSADLADSPVPGPGPPADGTARPGPTRPGALNVRRRGASGGAEGSAVPAGRSPVDRADAFHLIRPDMNDLRPPSLLCLAAAAALFWTGCTSGVKNPSGVPVTVMKPDEQGFVAGTGIESQDLVAVTDKMARSVLNTAEIRNFAGGPPRVALLPVNNETRFAINKDIFLTRVRVQLNSKANGQVRFLAREALADLEKERQMKREGSLTSTTDPNVQEFKGANFFLTGKLSGLTTKTKAGTSDYILYSFQLIDARTSDILWEDSVEVKKQGLEDAAYR